MELSRAHHGVSRAWWGRSPAATDRDPAPETPAARHYYCLRCDVPFSPGPRCPGCDGPGFDDRDVPEAQAVGDGA